MKKEKLNNEFYRIHLKAAQDWGNIWYIILDSIHNSINQQLENTTLQKKNSKELVHIQTKTPDSVRYIYPCVVNKTDITFSNDELTLLNKGLKYNLNHKHKNWIRTLALEAETAITKLPIFEQGCIRYQAAYNIKHLYEQQEK